MSIVIFRGDFQTLTPGWSGCGMGSGHKGRVATALFPLRVHLSSDTPEISPGEAPTGGILGWPKG